MCGIVGAVHQGNFNLEASIIAMRDAFTNRGPDDAGAKVWVDHGVGLGQRRLSIIDLSPLGHNPMSDTEGLTWITYNGEVYNYKEIRSELEQLGHTFRSTTDTEVVLHAYLEWGDQHVNRLRGMFAYAIYDRRANTSEKGYRLLLVRDHVGVKPLFYYWDREKLLFASEIKAILKYPSVDTTIDRSAIFDYLTYMYVPAPKTAYQHIRKLEPGHILVFNGVADPKTEQYWDVNFNDQNEPISEREAVEQVYAAIREAVMLNMVSDVPVGLFLSGGLDSSTVAVHMSRMTSEPINSFSIGFDIASHTETPFAKLMADTVHSNHRERIVGHGLMQGLLDRIIELYDEPFADASAIPMLEVSRLAHENGIKVVLSGDGGDEVFAGYRWYDRWLMQQNIGRYTLNMVGRRFLATAGHYWPEKGKGKDYKHILEGLVFDPMTQYARQMELFSPVQKREILGREWEIEFFNYDDYWYFRKYWRPQLDPITRIQYLDLKTYLPDDILTKVDRTTMAFSVEARPPLLDHVLIERVFRIPPEIRFRNNEKKYILKRAMASQLPKTILQRGKKGFSSPLNQWITSESEWIQRLFQQSPALINADALKHVNYRRRGPQFWTLMVLELWAKRQGKSVTV